MKMNELRWQMTPTSGDSYQLDIRLESAVDGEARSGSFLFVMPEITTTMDSLPLLDKSAMEGAGGAVVLHTPGASSCELLSELVGSLKLGNVWVLLS